MKTRIFLLGGVLALVACTDRPQPSASTPKEQPPPATALPAPAEEHPVPVAAPQQISPTIASPPAFEPLPTDGDNNDVPLNLPDPTAPVAVDAVVEPNVGDMMVEPLPVPSPAPSDGLVTPPSIRPPHNQVDAGIIEEIPHPVEQSPSNQQNIH